MRVERVLHKWAGLRTFTADRVPVTGWAPDAPGFCWLAGQGGYGNPGWQNGERGYGRYSGYTGARGIVGGYNDGWSKFGGDPNWSRFSGGGVTSGYTGGIYAPSGGPARSGYSGGGMGVNNSMFGWGGWGMYGGGYYGGNYRYGNFVGGMPMGIIRR